MTRKKEYLRNEYGDKMIDSKGKEIFVEVEVEYTLLDYLLGIPKLKKRTVKMMELRNLYLNAKQKKRLKMKRKLKHMKRGLE